MHPSGAPEFAHPGVDGHLGVLPPSLRGSSRRLRHDAALRLLDRGDLDQFAVGTSHKGIIKLEGIKTACEFKVRYLRGTMIGAEWVTPSAELIAHMTRILNPAHLGETLKNYPIPDSPNLVWYHTPVGVDLLLYKNEPSADAAPKGNNLGRWMLYFHQTFLQWELDSGLKTGQAIAEDDEGYAHGIVRLETRLLEYDLKVDRRLLETALEFISHAKVLDEPVRAMMKHQLEGALAV